MGKSWAAVTLKSGSVLQLPLTEGGTLNGTDATVILPSVANNTPLGAAFWGDILGFNPAHSPDSFALVNKNQSVFSVLGPQPPYPNHAPGWLLALAYLLCDFQSLEQLPKRRHVFSALAARVFGAIRFEALVTELRSELEALGYQPKTLRMANVTVARVLLFIRSVRIEDISLEVLQEFHRKKPTVGVERCLTALSRVLASKNLIPGTLLRPGPPRYLDEPSALLARVPEEWARQARHWYETSTSTPKMRITGYYRILNVGRWLQATHPDITSADQWTRATASAAIAMLATEKQGDWIHRRWKMTGPPGKLLAPGTRLHTINCVRTFFQDMQDWEAIPRRFDPYRAFRCPRSLTCLVGPDPRTIADDVWAKLIWAGLNLTEGDFLKQARFPGGGALISF